MIIKKCEFKDCGKAGTCKCPKDRSLSSYWHFCQKHAAEYNKNWNYYAGMTPDEINKQWERDLFGTDAGRDNADYQKLISDFLHGRAKTAQRKQSAPAAVLAALKTLGLSIGDGWDKIQKRFRELAKQEHPDTNKTKDQKRFVEISAAYQTLKKYFGK